MADGLPDWMDRAMSNRTKRLSRLGNAVVPQVAEYIGRMLMLVDSAGEDANLPRAATPVQHETTERSSV